MRVSLNRQYLFGVVFNGKVEDAVATFKKDDRWRPFVEISISNGIDLILYWWKSKTDGEWLWYHKGSQKRSELAQVVGTALLDEIERY